MTLYMLNLRPAQCNPVHRIRNLYYLYGQSEKPETREVFGEYAERRLAVFPLYIRYHICTQIHVIRAVHLP
jgi:hypothetical protein